MLSSAIRDSVRNKRGRPHGQCRIGSNQCCSSRNCLKGGYLEWIGFGSGLTRLRPKPGPRPINIHGFEFSTSQVAVVNKSIVPQVETQAKGVTRTQGVALATEATPLGVFPGDQLTRLIARHPSQAGLTLNQKLLQAPMNHYLTPSTFYTPCLLAYKKRLKQREVTEDALRRSLENPETKASMASENAMELNLKNDQLKVSLASTEFRCTSLEQRAILAEQKVAKL
ncbi:hypothetical protein LWI28_022349 [Acer negundo]|uniref:Uncharacterized protein n=1 Tax=Acer negundo TaxID=4023 RepID=A0AAD5I8E0_ACENE|nr:hypothetical protein LWI28_010285 [Acer negundo]KAI9154188.1 hypothetical protein LWI28_022349 [Acer negundo]